MMPNLRPCSSLSEGSQTPGTETTGQFAPSSGSCPACGSTNLTSFRSATGERLCCSTCFHSYRPAGSAYSYSAIAMCSLGTSDQRLQSQVQFMAEYIPCHASILEIGCATGELAALIRSKFPVARYEATELSPAADAAAQHLTKLHRRTLREAQASGEIVSACFDLLIASHVLEHLPELDLELGAMRAALKGEGALFIEVPNGSGNKILPFDDNISHVHFFTINSLARLLAAHGFHCRKITSGAVLDSRYSDSLRVIATPFRLPRCTRRLLSQHPSIANQGPFIIWGAGSLATELLANFFDLDQIAFFVDRDPAKHGKECLGRSIHSPMEALQYPHLPILVNSIDFAKSICLDVKNICGYTRKIIFISDLLC